MRILFFSFLLSTSFALQVHELFAAETGIGVGIRAPAFELRNLAGDTVALADYRGKIVLLNFWSTLCIPCTAEMPALNNLHLALAGKGFTVLAVSIDTSEKAVQAFIAKKEIAFPVLRDADKAVFFDEFAGPRLPMSYLIDGKGVILETFSGPQDWDSLSMMNKISKLVETGVTP